MSTETDTEKSALDDMKGAFVDSLRRNNKQIRSDRALAIAEDAEMMYKREIEDMEQQLKRLKRDRDNMLDLSPSDKNTLIVASDFDAKDFVTKDIKLGIEIRNLEIKLEVAKGSYSKLFTA